MIKIPTGIQWFPTLRKEGYVYIDKTPILYRLIQERPGCFFARPRRFGKTLLISTLAALFQGKRELFSGLWIDSSDYTWEEFPVIQLDLSAVVAHTPQTLASSLQALFKETANQYGITNIEQEFPTLTLRSLVHALFQRMGPVVILIDEYDQPLVKHFSNPSIAEANQELLSDFYANIKSLEQYLRFVFVTGVSQFTKVSLFSGMNHLKPISLRDDYATLLGLTEEEIITYFSPTIQSIAIKRGVSFNELLFLLKKWYNGYRYFKSVSGTKVYTPVSVFSFLETAQFDNYWFTTAIPTFAIDLIKQRNFPIPDLDHGIITGEEIEIAHDIQTMDIPTLLFQTGYLTISQYNEQNQTFVLDFPNEEVRRSFLENLLFVFSEHNPSEVQSMLYKLENCLNLGDLNEFFTTFNTFLASIPHQIHQESEGYYHSLLYLFLKTLGFRVQSEISTSQGRIDMFLKTSHSIFIFEFKINKTAEEALAQILQKSYHDQFKADTRKLVLIGVNFDTKSRQLNDWKLKTS